MIDDLHKSYAPYMGQLAALENVVKSKKTDEPLNLLYN